MNDIPLDKLAVGQCGEVRRISGNAHVSQRLLEMGLTPGATVEVIRFAPMGDPIDIKVRGYHLSLRRREAASVEVSLKTK
ncbi:MAG TPA: FeoA family protein [Candidatus Omnitrophota bacterium]|nr:FeoA family protein [Candidatus Omnitrophota bacterium]HPD84684.1 FeoA family protein [Candidatus Omnitrophota bacterium]HRZ03542.1 FeoA family protein [Candidatus Omnitrophota bacterium]